MTFITDWGVNKDAEASHNSLSKPLSRGVRPGLFDFQEIRTAKSTTKSKSVGYLVQKSDA